jgi:hypothetical protein
VDAGIPAGRKPLLEEKQANQEKGEDMNNSLPVLTSILLITASTALACHITGKVSCPNQFAVPGVTITVSAQGVHESAVTDADGNYSIEVPEGGNYTVTLVTSTLPPNSAVVGPDSVTAAVPDGGTTTIDWDITGEACGIGCWFTGGGALIDPDLGIPAATIRGKSNGKVADIAFGGNVYPGCSPTAGDGGSWNHVDRDLKLHFHGTDIVVVRCGNVPGIDEGSESPVTPVNFIEFQGSGWLKGIRGNKVDMLVTFFARCEDRNEPGSKGAKDGALIDRYYLQVRDAGGVLFQVGGGSPGVPGVDPDVVPVPITDGNFQLHISSCDKPPTP